MCENALLSWWVYYWDTGKLLIFFLFVVILWLVTLLKMFIRAKSFLVKQIIQTQVWLIFFTITFQFHPSSHVRSNFICL